MSKIKSSMLYFCAAIFWIIALVIGSFYDLDIARKVYLPNNIFAVVISVIGLYLYYGSLVFFLGVLCKQLTLFVKKKLAVIPIVITYITFAMSTSTYGGVAFLSDSVCGLLISSFGNSICECFAIGMIMFFPLFISGMIVNKKRCDKKVIKDLMIMLSIMTVAIFCSNIMKYIVMRPRFRIILENYEGITFVPWYRLIENGRKLKKLYHLASDDMASFFSGHAMNSMMGMMIYPAYSYVFDKLKGKEKQLKIYAVIITIPITFSRMILGDHYLSDVAVGAIVGIVMCLIKRTDLQSG